VHDRTITLARTNVTFREWNAAASRYYRAVVQSFDIHATRLPAGKAHTVKRKNNERSAIVA
jgi:hypothetical protein